MEQLLLGDAKITWLPGGMMQLDGGAMFGVVPKPLWNKRYPANELNQIPLLTDPLLIQVDGKHVLIEAGIGVNRLSDKQKRNYGLIEEARVTETLNDLGIAPAEIDIVIMTHMHYDHANGLVFRDGEQLVSTFPNAVIYIQEWEWAELRQPNIRSRNTYWEDNWRPIQQQVETYREQREILPGLEVVHTGGHSRGHSIVMLERNGECLLHLADLLPTHAHLNPLWVTAYDDYPLDTIFAKEKWLHVGKTAGAWFSFYHDNVYRAVKWSTENEQVDQIVRNPSQMIHSHP